MAEPTGTARVQGWGAGTRAATSSAVLNAQRDCTDGALLVSHKRGRLCTLAKLVRLRGEMVLAMPYQNRTEVREYVSLPMRALTIAREHGARRWLLRFKGTGLGYWILIEDALRRGHMQASEGRGELFVPISAFEPCSWPTWDYVPGDATISVDDGPQPAPLRKPTPQLALFGALT